MKKKPERDYEIGYGRPPKNQWRKGQSGYPAGRPKGAKNRATVLQGIFNRKISMRENGKRVRVSYIEALYLRLAEEALRGNIKAAAFLLAEAEKVGVRFAPLELPKDTSKMSVDEMIAELKNRNRDV